MAANTDSQALFEAKNAITNVNDNFLKFTSFVNGINAPEGLDSTISILKQIKSNIDLSSEELSKVEKTLNSTLADLGYLSIGGKLLKLSSSYDLPGMQEILGMHVDDFSKYNLTADDINEIIKSWVNDPNINAPKEFLNMNIGEALVNASNKNDIPVIIPLTFFAFRSIYGYAQENVNVDLNPDPNNIFKFSYWQKNQRVEGDVNSGLGAFDDFSNLNDVVDKSVFTIKYRSDPNNKLVGSNTFGNIFHEINLTGNNRYDEYDPIRNSGTGYIDSNRAADIFVDILNRHNDIVNSADATLVVEDIPNVTSVFTQPQEPPQTPQEPVQTQQEPVQTQQEPVQTQQEPVQTQQEPVQTQQEPHQTQQEPVQTPQENAPSNASPLNENTIDANDIEKLRILTSATVRGGRLTENEQAIQTEMSDKYGDSLKPFIQEQVDKNFYRGTTFAEGDDKVQIYFDDI